MPIRPKKAFEKKKASKVHVIKQRLGSALAGESDLWIGSAASWK